MTDLQLLIASPIGILIFYLLMRHLFKVADRSPNGNRMKKTLKPIIIIYAIAMTIQIISLVKSVFFSN